MHSNREQDASKALGKRTLTSFERRSLAVAALGMDVRTVEAAYADPSRVRESTLRRLHEAAKKLRLPSPYDFDAREPGE